MKDEPFLESTHKGQSRVIQLDHEIELTVVLADNVDLPAGAVVRVSVNEWGEATVTTTGIKVTK
jgi:hypothetical protein